MTSMRKITGVTLAAAAATMLLAGTMTSRPASAGMEQHCAGINACKGQSACKQAANDCKGQNACKGQGWLPTASKYECIVQGGTVVSS
jgi:uncharacterized membrane protein